MQKGQVELLKPLAGFNYANFFLRFKDNGWKVGVFLDEWKNTGKKILDIIKGKNGEKFYLLVKKGIFRKVKELNNFTEKNIHSASLRKKSNKELLKLYQGFVKRDKELYVVGFIPVFVDFHFTQLSDELENILKNRTSDKKKLAECMSILITPTDESVMKSEERELFEIAREIVKDKKAVEAFKTEKINLDRFPKIKKLIFNHHKRYCFLGYGYEGPAWDIKHFVDSIRGIINLNINPEEKLKEIKKQRIELAKKQREILEELNLNKKERFLFQVGKDFLFLKAYRKDALFRSYYHTHSWLEEVSKRFNLSLDQLRFVEEEEMPDLLLKGQFDKSILDERRKFSFFITENFKHRFIHGKEAEEFEQNCIEKEEIDEDLAELRGQCACPGEVKGTVKIVNKPEDMRAFNKGDILVSAATNPNLVPAMEKAGAIITDEGGLTCHAAIVSRELGIPCVIGTKIATKLLKKGEEIEVNATEGIIKRSVEEKEDEWGVYSRRPRLSPFPNVFSMEAISKEMKENVPYAYEKIMLIFQDRLTAFVLEEKDKARVEKAALENIKQSPDTIKKMTEKVETLSEIFINFMKAVSECSLKEKSGLQLFNYYKKFVSSYKEIYSAYFVALTVEKPLSDLLKKYLEEKTKDKEKASKLFSMLTTSIKAMYTKEEEKELLKAALAKAEEKDTQELVKNHVKNYFWITRDYEDPELTEEKVVERINRIINENTKEKIKEKLDFLEKEYETHKKDIKKIEKAENIDNKHSRLFEVMRDCIYLKELRKRTVSIAMFYSDKLLEEIGSRGNLTLKETRHLLSKDIEDLLINNKNLKKTAEDRIKLSVFIVRKGKTEIFTGEKAEEYKDKVYKIPKEVKELKGIAVSAGKAKGKAKVVVNPEDIIKVEQGDVMVTVQAVPSFISAVKKSSALIADGGTGITSHPATLAREAGIPGVTCLRIATEVIKDGDLVEVDGDQGTVRILGKDEVKEEKIIAKWTNCAEDYNASLFPIPMAMQGYCFGSAKYLGVKAKNCMFEFENKMWRMYIVDEEFKRITDWLFEEVKKNKKFSYDLKDQITKKIYDLTTFSDAIRNSNLKDKSNRELYFFYDEYNKKLADMYAWGVINFMIDSLYPNITNFLIELMKKKSGKKFAEHLTVMTTPIGDTIIKQEQREFFAMLGRIMEDKEAVEVFKEGNIDLDDFPEVKSLIKIHYKKYCFFAHGYDGPDYSFGHYVDMVRSMIVQGIDPEEEIRKLDDEKFELGEKQNKIAKELNLDEFELYMLKVGSDIAYIKDFRKNWQYKSYSDIQFLFREIVRRFNLDIYDIRFMDIDEVKDLLLYSKLPDRKILEERKDYCLYIIDDWNKRLISGKEAREYAEKYIVKEEVKEVKELKGQTACSGYAKGIVKHVKTPDDLAKFSKGDILVSPATNPNLVPAMEKAGAIITDAGGLACHAAIVSRELGVPCVIGTKIATKVLKEGEEVEVKADEGLVIRINYIPAMERSSALVDDGGTNAAVVARKSD